MNPATPEQQAPVLPGPSLKARKWSLLVLFFLPGLGMASWVTRTPAVRDLIDAGTAEMALVLLGLSVGSVVGTISSGPLSTRFGARPVIGIGLLLLGLGLPIIGLGAAVGSGLVVALGLASFGLGMGSAEVAMNIEGGQIELELRKTFLTYLHGFFSLGTVFGATAGIMFNVWDISVIGHLIIIGLVALITVAVCLRNVLAGTGKRTTADRVTDGSDATQRLWSDPLLLLIGVLVLIMALAEGTANDWLPLIMVDGHELNQTLGSVVFAVFAAAMTVGRFFGGRFVDHFGGAKVMIASAVSATIGLLVVSQIDHQATAIIAVILWGLGASLGFPVAVSAAGKSGANPGARVSIASTLGYLAFLVGPPLLGFLGEAVGLRNALLAPAAFTLAAIGICVLVQRLTRQRSSPS